MTSPLTEALPEAAWRAARLERLTAPDGWLCLIDLVWLEAGDHTIGHDDACAIRLPDGPPCLGTLEIRDRTACWHPVDGASCSLATDTPGPATPIRDGRYSIVIIDREGRLAARVRDAEAPARHRFAGIDAFPSDPRWRVEARWEATTGTARFVLDGQPGQLTPLDPAADPLQFVFADTTSGRETYGGGRFLYAERPGDGRLILDFNRAINPPCVFTPYATCPLPLPENRLPMAVTAGERWPLPA